MDLFVTAARKKFRFETARGPVSFEDLWDIPLSSKDKFNLDAIALQLDAATSANEKSYVRRRTPTEDVNKQKFELVKYVIDTRLEEADKAQAAALRREEKQKLLNLKADRQDQKLKEMSDEELEKRLREMD